MKLLVLVYCVVTLASLSIGTHAYDHHDDSAHLRGAIESIMFLTEDNDTCSELGGPCETNDPNNFPERLTCCHGSGRCTGPADEEGRGTCVCGLEDDYCTGNSVSSCCSGLFCAANRCRPPIPLDPQYDHQDESAHLRGAIEAINFLTEDNDRNECLLEGERCDRSELPCCEGLVCDGRPCERRICKPKSYL